MARSKLAICLIGLGLSIGASQIAFSQTLPGLYQVSNVETGDTLNVRSAPDASSDDIGDLLPDQTVEVTAISEGGNWGRIIHHEGDGWVSMRFVRRVDWPTLGTAGYPAGLSCGGTEPFWSFATRPANTVEFELAGEPPEVAQMNQTGRSHHGISYSIRAAQFTGVLLRAQCSDGMSDRTYGWQFELLKEAGQSIRHFSGCCQWRQ